MFLGSILISFFFFTCSCPVFPAPLIEQTIFSPFYIRASFDKDDLPIGLWAYVWVFYFVPLFYIYVFVPVPYCIDNCSFVMLSEVRKVDSSSTILLSQDCFGYSRPFVFPMNCEIFCSSSVKNAIGNWIGIALNLYIAFGSIVIFTILILLTQEH